MIKVSKFSISSKFAIILYFFIATILLFFTTDVTAKTISYSDPISYTVTTYEASTSSLEYLPTEMLEPDGGSSYFRYKAVEGISPKPDPAPVATIETKILAKASKYETKLYIIDSGIKGPVVMIIGGVHGNEPAGYKAAAKVKNYNLKKGKLLVLPEANKLAIEAGRRYASGESDLNRLFPQSKSAPPKNFLAKDIYNIIKDNNVDWLMDMHEGFDYYKNTATNSVGQTIIYYPANNAISTVEDIVKHLNNDIPKSLHKFTILRYPVQGSVARSSAEFLGVKSFIFETSMKQTLATRISLQEKAAQKLLSNLGML